MTTPWFFALPGPGALRFFGLLAALVLAFSAVPAVARLAGHRGPMTGYHGRTRGWWWVCGSVTVATAIGPAALALLVLLVVMLAQEELLRMSPWPLPRWGLRLGAVGLVAAMVWAPLWAAVLGHLALVAALARLLPRATGPESDRVWLRRVAGTTLALSTLVTLVDQPLPGSPGGWPGLFLFVVFLPQFNDLLQYSFGKLLGGRLVRRRLAPVTSPNKTWEGFVGGALATGLAAAGLCRWLTPFAPATGLAVGLGTAALGLAGDLTASHFKRRAGVKDAGTLLPGFGGMVDRVDSMLWVAPLAALWAAAR